MRGRNTAESFVGLIDAARAVLRGAGRRAVSPEQLHDHLSVTQEQAEDLLFDLAETGEVEITDSGFWWIGD